VADEKDYRCFEQMAPFGADITLPIFEEGDEPAYFQLDYHEAIIVPA
jgi:hypothetical protein